MINGDEILLSSIYSSLCQGIKISHTGTVQALERSPGIQVTGVD